MARAEGAKYKEIHTSNILSSKGAFAASTYIPIHTATTVLLGYSPTTHSLSPILTGNSLY